MVSISETVHGRDRAVPSRLRRSHLGRLLLVAVLVALPLALLELGTRTWLRLSTGEWPQTRKSSAHRDKKISTEVLFRLHPFLNVVPRAGGRLSIQRDTMTVEGEGARGVEITFNSLGYRSPERPASKPAGVYRVLCAGGSTTMDTLAPSDEATWPWMLETRLRGQGLPVEVWNAGAPGWTSLESLVSLTIRDLELKPDVVVLFVNDLQPAAHQPFDPQYEASHAGMVRQSLGFGAPELRWWDRSLALERARDLLAGSQAPGWEPLSHEGSGPVRREISDAAAATFERNLRSFIGVAQAHGARVVLVTSTLRIRKGHEAEDQGYLAWWIPWLAPDAAPAGMEKLNGVIRKLGAEGSAVVVDSVTEIPWRDEDFGDPFHFVVRDRFVQAVGERVAAALPTGAPGKPAA